MTIDAYTLVIDTVRRHLPDVAASRLATRATWRRSAYVPMLTAAGDRLRSKIVQRDRGGNCHTYSEQLDERTASVDANNIVVHFDPRFCRGIDVAPHARAEIAR
jgi:hypothetical protein